MSSGITKEITGAITIAEPYEMSAYDDVLNIIGATISLTVPGDIFTNEGADTVTISDSTFSGDEACGIYLGSGNDSLEIKNASIGIKLFTGSGNDSVSIKGDSQSSVVINRPFSLGEGDDLLEIASTLTINAGMDFGNGSDTLKFNGGKLVFSGAMSGLENLCVTASGGTLGNDLTFTGESSTIELSGNLNGISSARNLLWDNASVSLHTGSNIATNIAWSVANSTLSHSDGGSLEFTGTSGYGLYAENSTICLHDVNFSQNATGGIFGNDLILTLSNAGFSNSEYGIIQNGGSITLNSVGFSNHTQQALDIQDAELTGADVSFSNNAVGINTNADLSLASARFINNGNAIRQNFGNAIISFGVFSNNSNGAIIRSGGTMQLSSGICIGNTGARKHIVSSGTAVEGVNTNIRIDNNTHVNAAVFCQTGGVLIISGNGMQNNTASAMLHGAITSSRCYYHSTIYTFYSTIYNTNYANGWTQAIGSSPYYQTNTWYNSGTYYSTINNASINGAAICMNGGTLLISDSDISGNTANINVDTTGIGATYAGGSTIYNLYNSADIKGGAIYFSGNRLQADNAIFSRNSVAVARGNSRIVFANNIARAVGGAIYVKADICNLNDAVFTDNYADDFGGAIYADASPITYTVSENLKLQNTGNRAAHGGFLYNANGNVTFDIGNKAALTVGRANADSDSFAGNGTISKNGAGLLQIYSDVSEYTGKWIISEGEIWLCDRARNISLSNWTIGSNATLTLSTYDDMVTLGTDKTIGTLDLGGGRDTINTGGYQLSGGKLLVSSVTLTGGGSVSSDIFVRESGTGFDITLNDVTLNSNITGGNAIDKIAISQQSTLGGTINLGDGNNIITATAGVVFVKTLAVGSGDDTFAFTDATFKDKVIISGNGEIPVNGEQTQERNSITASGTATFDEDVYTGNGFDTLSFQNVTFRKNLDLGAQENSLTATGIATFGGNLISYDGNDTFRFSDAIINGDFNLGSGNNTVVATGELTCSGPVNGGDGNDTFTINSAEFVQGLSLGAGTNTVTATGVFVSDGALSGGSGNDTITLKNTSTIDGEIALGGGRNYIYVTKSLTVGNGFRLDASGETHLVVYNGASLGENSLTLYDQAGGALTSVTMNWSTIPDLDKVRIVVSSDHTFKNFEFTVELYNQTKSFTLNLPDTYFIQFQAQNEDGWAQRLLPDNIAPGQVSGVEFTGKKLVWDAVHDNLGGNGVKQYTVQVSTDSGFDTILESAIETDTEYALQTTESGNYYFRVRAEDYSGNQGEWSTVAVGELDTVAPSRPSGGKSTVNGYDATLSWSASTDTGSGIKEYEYRIASDSAFAGLVASGTTEALSLTTTDLIYGVYYWQVRAVDRAGNVSDWSLSRNFKIADNVAPSAPTNPDFGVDKGAVTVIWDGSVDDAMGSGLKCYRVQIASDGAFVNIVRTVDAADTEIEIAGLTDGTYYLRICAVDNAGNLSTWTETLDFEVISPEKHLAGDLNGDGRTDVVMTITQSGHGAEGATGAWLIQRDQTAAWGDLSQRNAGWEIFGTGVTTAGKSTNDVYVKSADNVIGAWTTGDDGKVTGWETVGEFDANTQVLGLGDFNGDGQIDLLLRNTNGAVGCYLTDGTGWNYFQSLGDEWSICAVGDLNGDGRDDVVLKHDAGFAGSWLTQSDCTMAWANLDTLPDGFSIVGAGDLNGDGTDDVLLKTGNYYGAWIVQDGNAKSWMGLGDLGNVTVEQIGDFDGDGIDDLRIRTATGDLGAQLVNGADTLEWKYYGSVGPEWSTALAAI